MKDIHCNADIPETADTLGRKRFAEAQGISLKITTWIVLPMIPAWKWKP